MTIKLGAADLNYLLQQVNIENCSSQLTNPLARSACVRFPLRN